MDLSNNEKGINAANALRENARLTWSTLEEEGIKSLREGKLNVVKPGQQIRYPDKTEK